MADNNQNNLSFNNENESEFQLSDIIELVWAHKWWYVLSVVFCLSVAVFLLYRTQKTYERSIKVLVDESNQDATMRNLGVTSASMMKLRGMNSVVNEIEAFNSPDLMQVIVERLGLETKYYEKQPLRSVELYQNNPIEMKLSGNNPMNVGFSLRVSNLGDGKILLSEFRIKKDKFDDKIEAVLGEVVDTPAGSLTFYATDHIDDFKYDIRISWRNSMSMAKAYCKDLSISMIGKESTVLQMSHKDHFPQRSASILNSLVDVYNESWVSNKNKASVNTSEFINERLVIIEKELATVEEALKEYKSSNNLTDIKASAQVYINESSQYSAMAFEINNKLTIAKYIKEYLNDPNNSRSLIPSNLGLDNNSVDSQINEYNNLVLKRDHLAASSSESNPIVADFNSLIASMRVAILSSIENVITTLQLQQDKIDAQEKQILSRISSSSGQELRLLSIERQQQITQELYMFLLQKR